MTISVASGKGGTGKTTVATNLALALTRAGRKTTYIDCDVEEPNGHVYLKPAIKEKTAITVPVPRARLADCDYCGRCSEVCEFHALAVIRDKGVMVFPELCHSCGACYHICPRRAIDEIPREIGHVVTGSQEELQFIEGRLNVGEIQAPPLIKATKAFADRSGLLIVDAPPGTTCPAIEAVADSDFALLVTEPTPFGLHDLQLAVGMLRQMNIPHGVVINRDGIGTPAVDDYCRDENIDILLRIPYRRDIAEICSRGEMIIDKDPDYSNDLHRLFDSISARVAQ